MTGEPRIVPSDEIVEGLKACGCVSRETFDRLQAYVDLVLKWQRKINLIGPSTVPEIWRRHVLDSAQLWPLLPKSVSTVTDLGSGAGFPGLVLAIMGLDDRDLHVHLVECDERKAVFLRHVAAALALPVTVHVERLEALDPWPSDVVTARALAPLDRLMDYAWPFLSPGSVAVFPKGRTGEEELTRLSEYWTVSADWTPSRTDPDGRILVLTSIARRDPSREVPA